MKGPRQLSAHERGQVAHLVRTTPGARLFARTDHPPPAEWLCVFDVSCRIAKKSSGYGEGTEIFDPFSEYGLDDDPPRPPESDRGPNGIHDHILEWRRGDTNPPTFHKLGDWQVTGLESMPPRLSHLSDWIIMHINSPVAAWWAMHQRGLHPQLTNKIQNGLRRNTELHPEARRIWNLILEYQSDNRNFSESGGWFNIKNRIENEGWTPSVLRDFEAVTAPILSLERSLDIGASKPPFNGWEETNLSGLAGWKVKFLDRYDEGLDIPDEVLEYVFRITEKHFHQAAGLLDDLNTVSFTAPTCYPERDVEGEDSDHNADFRWFLELFARMVSTFPVTARAHAVTWPSDDKFYFKRLKLFALNHVELFEADEAAESLLALSQEVFWGKDVRRELLFLLNDRWESFSVENRTALVERLLNGPDKMDNWSDEKYPNIRNKRACSYTRWLTLQGRALLQDQVVRLDNMISGLPEWSDDWASNFVKHHFGYVRRVGIDETPGQIIGLPVTEVVKRAKAEHGHDFDNFTEKRPFTGLVKDNPRKALASLSHSARNGEYPQEFWSTLISDWPEETRSRLFCIFLHRLCRLPYESIRKLRSEVGRWIEHKFLLAFEFDKVLAWNIFDHLVSGLISEDGVATRSGMGEIQIGGEVIEHSQRTIEYAGPVGNAVRGLYRALDSLKLNQGERIPEEFKSRFERLIAAPGEGGDHTVAILTKKISWLYYLDPEWVKDRVIPWFNFDHASSEPAWNGYLYAFNKGFPPQKISVALKPFLLNLFPRLYQWRWDQSLAKVASQIIIELAVCCDDKSDGLNAREARHCLRNMNDKNRRDAVLRLCQIGKREEDGWSVHVIPFINDVWPRERAFRTSSLASSWVSLLIETGDKFPEVLSAVRRYLVPVERKTYRLYRFSKGTGGEQPLTIKYPEDVLELLGAVVPDSAEDVPYGLDQMLDLIGESDPNLVRDRRFVRLIDLIEQTH